MSSCTNVRELILGQRDDVRDAIAKARQDLARYPSERALFDLMAQMPKVTYREVASNPVASVIASAAAVPSAVLGNDRLITCSLVASP